MSGLIVLVLGSVGIYWIAIKIDVSWKKFVAASNAKYEAEQEIKRKKIILEYRHYDVSKIEENSTAAKILIGCSLFCPIVSIIFIPLALFAYSENRKIKIAHGIK